MTSEEIDKIVAALKEERVKIQDFADAEACMTFSKLMKTVNHSLQEMKDENKKTNDEIMAKLNPVYDAFQKASGFKATLYIIGSTFATVAGIIISWREMTK